MLRIISGATLLAALLLSGAVVAQSARPKVHSNPAASSAPAAAPLREAAPGTYQLVRLTPKRDVSLSSDALVEIERRRQENDEVSWLVNAYARVRILPRRVINAPGFQPLSPVVNAY